MLDVSQVHWLLTDPPDSWRGAGGLPSGWAETDGVFREDHPPADYLPHVLRVTRTPPQGRVLTATILSDHLQGAWTHWDGDGVRLCRSPAGSCPYCAGGSPSHPLGWLVIQRPCQYPELCELPASLVLRTPYLQRRDSALRGRSLRAVRRKGGRNGPVTLVLSEPPDHPEATDLLPDPVDCRPAVCRLYG